ncbi:putative fucosyltransferase [Trichinella spiralis]|uniref:Fucosyltransferase n=1 Tax=Trichinella spiralis TaxID=6334 RepID=A0ABR3KNU4_TRISP
MHERSFLDSSKCSSSRFFIGIMRRCRQVRNCNLIFVPSVVENCSMSDSVSTTEFVTNFPLRKLFCCHLKFATFQPTENSWTLLVDVLEMLM